MVLYQIIGYNLDMDISHTLEKYKIKPDVLKDQFFLTDENIIRRIIDLADINKSDVVLEVGAGVGNLTSKLAKHAGRVISFEIDERFKPLLDKLPKNVEMYYENAWECVQLHGKFRKKKEYNKIVANLPYSFVEQFLHNLTFLEYDKVILLIPIKMVRKINENAVFGSFFRTKILLTVPKEKFYPAPRTNSVVIDLVKLSDPLESKNLGLFLRQYMYQREDKLVKNSLMDGLIDYSKLAHHKAMTKNEARAKIAESRIPNELLEKHPNNSEIYDLVSEKFKA